MKPQMVQRGGGRDSSSLLVGIPDEILVMISSVKGVEAVYMLFKLLKPMCRRREAREYPQASLSIVLLIWTALSSEPNTDCDHAVVCMLSSHTAMNVVSCWIEYGYALKLCNL